MSNPEKTIAPETSSPSVAPIDPAFTAAAHTLMQRCDALGKISDDELPRMTRTFLSPATKRAHALVSQWMREAGLTVRTDPAGNVIGRREAAADLANATTKTFVIGSHLDTVPNAGKYDGILGVLAGIALADLTRNTPLPFPLEIVAFSEEEGVRFNKPYIGSHSYAGTLDPAWLQLTDKNNITVEQAIQNFGLDPTPLKSLTPRTDLLAYLELHIEQGPLLDSLNLPLGIATAIAGQTRITLEFTGTPGHAGTSPMLLRADALVAAAEFIIDVESHARSIPDLVATVGHLENSPNASNVIPGRVKLSLDVRHPNDQTRTTAVTHLLDAAPRIAALRKTKCITLSRADFPAVPMHSALIETLKTAARGTGTSPHLLVSGAGHDAAILARITPSAMLFLRSPSGISHNPEESINPSDLLPALKTLHTTLLTLAQNQAKQ